MPKTNRKAETPTLASIKRANAAAGGHWFDPGAMRFFHSRIEPTVYAGKGGVYFVTSETPDDDTPRRFSVRKAVNGGRAIETLGAFRAHETVEGASDAAKKAAGGRPGKASETCCAANKAAHEGAARPRKVEKKAKPPTKPKATEKRKPAPKQPPEAPTPRKPAMPRPHEVDTAPERRATAALKEMVSALNRAGQVETCEEAWAALMDAQRHRQTARRHLLSIPKTLVPRAERLVKTLKEADRYAAKLVKLIGWCQSGEGRAA